MLKKILFTLGLLLAANVVMYSQGVLTGTITDSKTKEPLPFVNVIVVQNGQQKGGATTNMDGTYQIKPLNPGTYDIKASYVGYKSVIKEGVRVVATGFSTGGDITMTPTSEVLQTVEVQGYKVPLIEKGSAEQGKRITSDDIDKMSANSVDAIIATVGGVADNNGSAGSARGESDMQNYVNGVKKQGSVSIPKSAISEVQIILGGTPARYGETIGGAANITLKPPQNTFLGSIQYRTSEPFDTRGYHRGEFFLTGPIYTKTDKATGAQNTIIGFRLDGSNTYVQDPYFRPSDRYYHMVKDNVLTQIQQNPLVYRDGAIQYAASYLNSSDFEQVGRKSNLWSNTFVIEGGLDIRISKNTSLKLNGQYVNSMGKNGALSTILLNNDNNSESKSSEIYVMANLTQRLSTDNNASSKIKNILFDIIGSYQKDYSETYNKNHKDDYFKYGHVGTFRRYFRPEYQLQRYDLDGDGLEDGYAYVQSGSWNEYRVDYTPSTDNPGLSAYTSQLYSDNFSHLGLDLSRLQYIQDNKGLINGSLPSSVYGLYTNVGVPSTSYSKAENEYINASVKVSADIGKHSLELGFQYEQDIYRAYQLAASSLWTIMRQEANQQILYRDLDNPHIDRDGYYPYISYDRNYDGTSQTYFDKHLRQALGLAENGTEYIDIDSYDPSTFSLDMFSADELYNSGNALVSYYGYDHTGKKVTGKQALQDYFSGKNGQRNLGAWEPIYMAGYIQDQFLFRDLIFNVGVRVDRFDGNQMGLKDPYLLYSSYTAGELRKAQKSDATLTYTIPSSVSDDATVYVNSLSSTTSFNNVQITGYRSGKGSGTTWYNADGAIVSDPSDVSGASGQPLPYRKGKLLDTGYPTEISTDAFKDYEPQVVAMPRIAFSFPVSDKSEFKASYDIIARRPGEGYWQANYASYLFMEKMSGATLTNPNLKPEKITNYELGFQQVLSASSVLSLSAYYKQTRDLIALVQYVGADPTSTYYSYDNQDFRTTKGLTISYDLRRFKNIKLNANYTLQYAEGTTGLPSTTLQSLIKAGYPNVKMMFPISDDRRHAFKLGLDFRYEGGDKYNGPTTKRKVKDKDGNTRIQNIKWLQNFGINLTGVMQSGAPYTKYYSNKQYTIVGSYRGSRLPWNYRLDLTADKAFVIPVGKKTTMLDVFCTITNVLNVKNITGVFGVTGDPDDNGYLSDPETQTEISVQLNEAAYRNYYSMYLNDGYYNYSTPRMVYIGVSYQF
ncbi:MAG: TonB-dependent receptor [Bacteroidales bacterium]|nr:TonB-dependent receptor [Bacteroidales bacterium]